MQSGVNGTPALHTAHIHALELTAMFLTCLYFQSLLRAKHFLIRTENRIAVFYINHQGGTRSRSALQVAHKLLVWAQTCFPAFHSGSVSARPTQSCRGCSVTWQGVTGRLDSTPGSDADDMEDLWDCSGRGVHRPLNVSMPSLVLPEGQTRISGSGCTSP